LPTLNVAPGLAAGGVFLFAARMTGDTPLGSSLNTAPPDLSERESLDLLVRHWGIEGRLDRLTSERDLNWRVSSDRGRYVLKFANRQEDPEITRFQNLALQHIAARDPSLPVPRVIPAVDGATEVPLVDGSLMRLLSWVEGRPAHLAPPSSPLRRGVGAMAGRLTRALQGFDHPAAGHHLQWDIKQASGLRALVPDIADDALRDLCAQWLDWFDAIRPGLDALPWQVVHADLNPHNLLTNEDDATVVAGVLDFGDMVRTPRICDLAVAASYQIDPAAPLASLAEVAEGWADSLPLLPEESALLPGLTAIRMVTTIAITSYRAAHWPDNATYILRNFPSAKAGILALPRP
jgi:Ser/Thr protein kinase RdoA (MazF antagonist)